MSRYLRPMLPVVLSLALVMLGSCGGGGGGDAPAACAPIADSAGGSIACDDPFWGTAPGGGAGGADGDAAGADGTAGDGRAIAGATITLVDAGGQSRSAVSDAQGYYRVNITRFAPPFVVKLVTADGEERHHAFSTQAVKKRGFITINITGLTDKLASDVAIAGGKPGAKDLTPAIVAAQAAAIQTARNNLTQAIRNQVIAAGITPESFDPIAVFFRPNLQGYDLILETVAVFIDNSGATQVMPKPQNACTAPRRWTAGGNLCTTSNSPGFVAHGATGHFSDTSAPLVGSADFSCSNGTLLQVGTPTCAPPANQPCSAPTATWSVAGSSCNADSAPGSVPSGQSLTLTDSQSPTTGTITYACSNGTLSQTGTAACSNAANNCAAPSGTWTVGSNACTSDTAPTGLAGGQSVTLQDATGAAVGSITYACSGGVLSQTGETSCGLIAQSCSAPSAAWNVGGSDCTADLAPGPLATGESVTLNDTKVPGTGSISYTCSNGTLSRVGTASCQSATGSGCSAPSAGWSVQGLSCQSSTTPVAMNSSEQQTLQDSSAPTLGSIVWGCSGGSLSVLGSPSCALTAGSCAPPSNTWASGDNVCTADSAPVALSNNQSTTLADSASPTTGNVTWMCSNGTLSMVGSPVCNLTQPVGCAAPPRSWIVDDLTCAADSEPSPIGNGGSATLTDSLAPRTGAITYACSDGRLSVVGSATCTGTSGGGSCSTSSLVSSGWSVSGNNCLPDQAPASVTEGTTLVLQDTVGSPVGQITVQCGGNGQFTTIGQPTCGPNQTSCQTSVSSWSNPAAGFTCTPDQNPGTVTIPSGSTFTWTDTVSPTTGSHTLRCDNGSLNVVNSSCGPGTGGLAAPRERGTLGSPGAAPARPRHAR
ncbi:hypothetical protein HLB44_24490 [Aquincola sp. S2]|uniref:Sushi domain-containing protein n=1 Tax=Pseudaquabacterium terrae TaxID=2732868 RepID=A0ABX2EN99_9BURK|nr:hypothetical protein [Aquabacterium terrae]NRF70170.1 hypothetical protein [Aquabacterium terrae]